MNHYKCHVMNDGPALIWLIYLLTYLFEYRTRNVW